MHAPTSPLLISVMSVYFPSGVLIADARLAPGPSVKAAERRHGSFRGPKVVVWAGIVKLGAGFFGGRRRKGLCGPVLVSALSTFPLEEVEATLAARPRPREDLARTPQGGTDHCTLAVQDVCFFRGARGGSGWRSLA